MFKVLCLLLASLCVAYAALGIELLGPKPEKFKDQPGCYIKELDTVIPFGKSTPSKISCKEYRCGSSTITHASCGIAVATPPCKLVEDKSKPYPDCCPRLTCG